MTAFPENKAEKPSHNYIPRFLPFRDLEQSQRKKSSHYLIVSGRRSELFRMSWNAGYGSAFASSFQDLYEYGKDSTDTSFNTVTYVTITR